MERSLSLPAYLSYPQLGVVFALTPSLHSFWSYFSTLVRSILGAYRPGEFIFQCHIFLPFHTVHGVLKARILKWFAIDFSIEDSRESLGLQGDQTSQS